jgi:hypothetical protein
MGPIWANQSTGEELTQSSEKQTQKMLSFPVDF